MPRDKDLIFSDLSYQDFQRELAKRDLDPAVAFLFTMVYERLVAIAKDVDLNATTLLEVANSMEGLATLNEQTQTKLAELERRNMLDGVDFKSEPFKN